MDKVNAFLACEDLTIATGLWDEMFLNPEIAVALVDNPSLVGGLINKAFGLAPSWTTTRSAVQVERLTGMAMVAATTKEYNESYLYSIALGCEVDPGGQFTLTDRQAEVAFKLCRLWRAQAGRALPPAANAAGPGGVPSGVSGAGVSGADSPAGGDLNMDDRNSQAESEEDSEPPPLAWEESDEPLPDDLSQVLQRFQYHGLQVQTKDLLDCCPRWSGLKTKAEINNFKNDGMRVQDRNLKMLQQKLLGLQRIYPILHINLNDNEEAQQLGQKFFALLLEAEKWVITKRKEASLPGAIIPQDPQLFTQEDLKNDNQNQKFRPTGSSSITKFSIREGMSHFPTNTGFTKPKYRGKGGFQGRGIGYRSYGFGFKPKADFNYGAKGFLSRSNKGKGKCPSPTTSLKRTHSGLGGGNFGTHSGPIGAKDPESFLSIIPNLPNGLSPKGRKVVGRHPSLPKTKSQIGLVEKKCFKICGGNNKKWYQAPLGSPPPCLSKITQGEVPIWYRHKKYCQIIKRLGP